MPFDENRWNYDKMVSYKEMIKTITAKWPDIQKLEDGLSDTSKVKLVNHNDPIISNF